MELRVVPFQSKLIVFWGNMSNTCVSFGFTEEGEYLEGLQAMRKSERKEKGRMWWRMGRSYHWDRKLKIWSYDGSFWV